MVLSVFADFGYNVLMKPIGTVTLRKINGPYKTSCVTLSDWNHDTNSCIEVQCVILTSCRLFTMMNRFL